ncbi:MAG TPA: amidohydrolase [Steroidobacteraceae bacterium]|nr:amidohydrolase [Steroidobacteraceae bacterium]
MSVSRRQLLCNAGALATLPLLARPALAAILRQPPELILHNGNLITMDARQPRAEAVAIAGGRILAVGADVDILEFATADTRKLDLGGQTAVPGFIDGHCHPAYSGRRHLRFIDCDLRSIAAIQDAVRERAAKTPPGEWVCGFKYDDTKTTERRFITREDLDAAAPHHPVFIGHRGGHTGYVNSLALQKAGISEKSRDPEGGRFERDPATGRLTGRLLERAAEIFETTIPAFGSTSREEDREAIKLITRMFAKAGVTSSTDAYGSPDDLRAYQDAREAGELHARIYCMIGYTQLERMIAAGIRTGFGDEWIRVGGMKATCDGSISERTARLSQPYVGRPNDFGMIVADADELYEYGSKAHEAGWQVGIHANGDVGIGMVLDLYERLQRERPRRDPRFRIEHCTVINDVLVQRMKALGVIPTPFSTYVYFHGEKMQEYGEERLDSMFALRSFIDAGIRATLASDYPPGPFEPMMALQSMVTRTDITGKTWGPRQKITVEEALRVCTLNGAYASFEENEKGSLQPGKLADVVVLGRNPLEEDPASLVTIPIERTMVGGNWVYES